MSLASNMRAKKMPIHKALAKRTKRNQKAGVKTPSTRSDRLARRKTVGYRLNGARPRPVVRSRPRR